MCRAPGNADSLQKLHDMPVFGVKSTLLIWCEASYCESMLWRLHPASCMPDSYNSYRGVNDLQDLTWEDREKVLRLLFAKLNDPKQQAFFERLPAHVQA